MVIRDPGMKPAFLKCGATAKAVNPSSDIDRALAQ
jgi:hypothetical protein